MHWRALSVDALCRLQFAALEELRVRDVILDLELAWLLVGQPCSYWRAIAIRISLSLSVMRSPDTSTTTERKVPVNRNGDG